MRQITVAVDLDSTIYNLHEPWLAYLRDILGEDVSAGFQIWDVHKQFPRSGSKVYYFLRIEGMFFNLKPIPGALEAIRAASTSVRHVFVTTCTTRTGAWEKQQAIKRDFPGLAENVLVTSGIKDAVAADLLIDDGPHNLTAWRGLTCKIPYRYNDHIGADYTMSDWSEYPAILNHIARKGLAA